MEGRKKGWLFPISAGAFLTGWMALYVAPFAEGGMRRMLPELLHFFEDPFRITFHKESIRVLLLTELIYMAAVFVLLLEKKNYRPGKEHGSARWGDTEEMGKKYLQESYPDNKLMTRHVGVGLDTRKHQKNLHTIVVGGSGAGKTRYYCKPNLMQSNTSFVVLDPKGELTRDMGNLLKEKGYEIRVLDLIHMERSHCYNPLFYLKTENDVQKLVTNLFKATTPKGSKGGDPFWDTAASMLLLALLFFLQTEAPEEEQNFAMVMEMLRAGDVSEEDEGYKSPLDLLFEELEREKPGHIALKYYRDYHTGSAKTLKSIRITLVSRLEKFNLDSVSMLTATDELDLGSLGRKKVALFAIIPDNDSSFNFLVSILYTQLFQQLFLEADKRKGGSLAVPVHFCMDEFANVSLPDDFDKLLAVMRARGIFVSIILQNLAQLKALYEKEWESVIGNCDEFLYLGGNEQGTHKYISEQLGKETIDTNTFGKTSGRGGSFSKNFQTAGRELMTPDEVRMLDNRYAILFLRGERPVMDEKYDLLKHPDVHLSADGGGEIFEHGKADGAVLSLKAVGYVSKDEPSNKQSNEQERDISKMELLTEEELIKRLKEEEENEEK